MYIYIYSTYLCIGVLFWFLLEYIYIYMSFMQRGHVGMGGQVMHASMHGRRHIITQIYIYILMHASMHPCREAYSMAHVQHSCCLCKLSQALQLHGRHIGSKLRRFRPHPPLCSWRLSPWCPWLMWHGWLHSSRVAWVLLLTKRSANTGTADRTDEASGSCSEEPKGPTSPETSASCA